MPTRPTLNIALQNNTGSSAVWAYVTGLDLNKNNARFLLSSDGQTGYYPGSPSSILAPLAVDCAIALGAPGSSRIVTIPQLAGARVWFAVGSRLTFLLNPGPALVEPSATNPSDPNYNLLWSFAELTFNSAEVFANISNVDFVSLPVSLALRSATNPGAPPQAVGGLAPDGLARVCAGLTAQHAKDGAGWDQLVIKTASGQNLRALSPNAGIALRGPSLFAGYWKAYVDQVWAKYSSTGLTVDTQAAWGKVRGRVNAANGLLTFTPGSGLAVAKPSAADIFSCSTGAFANTAGEMGAINARLAAAFNRSTLLANADQPNAEAVGRYYAADAAVTNHYARLVHAASSGGLGYAFPYDDVAPNVAGANVAGTVADANPDLLVVAVGGPATMPRAAGATAKGKAAAGVGNSATRPGNSATRPWGVRQWVLGKMWF